MDPDTPIEETVAAMGELVAEGKVRVELDDELGAIGWPNGADVAPETLHLWVTSASDRYSAKCWRLDGAGG